MLARHINELNLLLERVYDIGCGDVRRNEILRWYGQERMSVSIWRDIQDKWEEITEESSLLVGEGDGVFAFAYGIGLETSEQSWFKNINELSKKKKE